MTKDCDRIYNIIIGCAEDLISLCSYFKEFYNSFLISVKYILYILYFIHDSHAEMLGHSPNLSAQFS